MAQFTDGTSKAIVVGERLNPYWEYNNAFSPPRISFKTGTVGGVTHWIGLSTNNAGIAYAQVVGTAAHPINAPYQITGDHSLSVFSSQHRGGAQFVLGDGAVRFLQDSIDLTIYKRLAHLSDGNIVGDF